MTIVEFNEALAVALNADVPIESMNGARVWVLTESLDSEYTGFSRIAIATSLEAAKLLADERLKNTTLTERSEWVVRAMGLRGPSAYGRLTTSPAGVRVWQRIEQDFLNEA